MNKFKEYILKLKYKNKAKKLNISDDFLDFLIEREDLEDSKDILSLIDKCNSFENFQNSVLEFLKNNEYNCFKSSLLVGNLLGFYNYSDTYTNNKDNKYLNNFKIENKEDLIPVLRENFYDYVMNNNEIKNELYPRIKLDSPVYKDYTKEFDKEYIINLFDKCINNDNENADESDVVYKYLVDVLNNYPIDMIKNNFGFILYDLNHFDCEKTVEERLKTYNNNEEISDIDREHLKDIDLLKFRLKSINSQESLDLLNRLKNIEGNEKENLEELKSIYLDYEIIYREDLVNHLYVPKDTITLVEDFNDVRTVLVHQFIRDPEELRDGVVERIKEEIKKENNNNSEELSSEEQKEFERRTQYLDDAFNQTKVNYSFGNIIPHSDSTGFVWYISDSDNQISASLLGVDYFIKQRPSRIKGIGFDKDGLTPEAIALSSQKYLTTNKGLNNLEYVQSNEFELLSATYYELQKSNSKSEVVLYRRNIDYDTKASYIFCTIDSSDSKSSKETIEECKELAEKNNLKLVIYDVYKIYKSYQDAMNEEENLEKNTNLGLH